MELNESREFLKACRVIRKWLPQEHKAVFENIVTQIVLNALKEEKAQEESS